MQHFIFVGIARLSPRAFPSIHSNLSLPSCVNHIECRAINIAIALCKTGLSLERVIRKIFERVRCDETRRRIRGVNIRKI